MKEHYIIIYSAWEYFPTSFFINSYSVSHICDVTIMPPGLVAKFVEPLRFFCSCKYKFSIFLITQRRTPFILMCVGKLLPSPGTLNCIKSDLFTWDVRYRLETKRIIFLSMSIACRCPKFAETYEKNMIRFFSASTVRFWTNF